jgi:hypothetical protein
MADERVTTCTNHCSHCGSHFHSLGAFDAHHRRDEEGWVTCLTSVDLVDLLKRDVLEILTEHGECRMYDNGSGMSIKRDVTIWTLVGSRERAAALWGEKGPESPPAAA